MLGPAGRDSMLDVQSIRGVLESVGLLFLSYSSSFLSKQRYKIFLVGFLLPMIPWYLYLALKQLFPSGRRVSFFFLISVCGVMLGVMILVIVQSVMGGFGMTYREKIVATNGHLRIETGEVIFGYSELLNSITANPAVRAAAPYAQGVIMLQHDNRPAFPILRGIDIELEPEVIPINEFIIIGGLDGLDDDSVLLSNGLAASIGATLGSEIEIYTPLMLEKIKQDEILLPRELSVAGIYETGWNDFDSNTMVGTLRLMQELYNLRGGILGITVRLKPGYDEEQVAREMSSQFPPPNRVLTWLDMYEDLLWILRLEKNMMFFLLIFIVIVAAFVIAIAQLLTVLRKTREIGLLAALGGKPRQLMACFCFQGFFIGVLGTALGILVALVALYFRNDIIYGFSKLTGSEEVLLRFYQFARLPVHYTSGDFIVISVSALLLTTLAGLIPAWRAARMKPAEALRSE